MTVASYEEATRAERDDTDRATLVLQAAAELERLTFAATIKLGATERPWQVHGEFQPGTLEPGTGREIVAEGRTPVKPPLSGILRRRFACRDGERLHSDLELRMMVGPRRVPSAKLSLSWSGDCRGENLHCAADWSGAE